MEKIHLRKKIIRCGLIVASQLVIICGASALKTEKADAANKKSCHIDCKRLCEYQK